MIQALASRLARFRVERRLSQQALAALLGIHPTLLGRWERGEEPIPARRLDPVARALELPVEAVQGLWTPSPRHPPLPGHRVRPPALPPYRVKGSVEEMLALGPLALRVYDRAMQRTPSPAVRDELAFRVPRDCPLELFTSYLFTAVGCELEFHALLGLGFRELVVETFTNRYIGDIPRHAFVLRRPGAVFAAFPQVSIMVPAQSRERRTDFLLYATSGRRVAWIDVEIDGDLDLRNANDDARRAVGLRLPRRGYDRSRVLRDDFMAQLMRDARQILERGSARQSRGRGRRGAA